MLTEEMKTKLMAAGRTDLIKIDEINESGFAGILPNGGIVDRREFPEAIPILENKLLGVPARKYLPGELYKEELETIVDDAMVEYALTIHLEKYPLKKYEVLENSVAKIMALNKKYFPQGGETIIN